MTEKGAFRLLFVALLVAGGVLAFAIAGRQPAEFYTALRWICSTVFGWSAGAFVYYALDYYRTCRRDDSGRDVAPVVFHLIIAVIAVAGAVVFNPIAQLHFPRKTWLLIDKVSLGVVILVAFIYSPKLELPRFLIRWFKMLVWLIVAGFVAYYTAEDVVHLYGKYALATASTTAKVFEMEEEEVDSDTGPSGVRYTGLYQFTVDGKAYYGRTDNYDVGDELVVRYNPGNPAENRDPTEGFRPEVESLLGCVIIVAAVGYWLRWILVSDRSSPTSHSGRA